MNTRLKAGSAALALAVAFIGGWEGLSLTAYPDTGGVPTICYGATRGVKIGQKATKAECDAMFSADLLRHETDMRACLKHPDALSDQTYIAILDYTYNVGGGAACTSTLYRKLNAGDVAGACDQLPRWVRDNGRVIPGLVNRRASDRDLCLAGLP